MDMTLTISHLCVSTWVCVCLYVCVRTCVCVWSYTQEAHLWLASVFPRLELELYPWELQTALARPAVPAAEYMPRPQANREATARACGAG